MHVDSNLTNGQQQFLRTAMAIILLAAMVIASRKMALMKEAQLVSAVAEGQKEFCVVIDPGHGGRDGGKQGKSGLVEKDINLAISLRLKDQLEKVGIKVIMTRETDEGLYKESDSNKKASDLRARLAIIEQSKCDIVISVHQNSYTDSNVKGAQVFYYSTSSKGKTLAETIQNQLVAKVDPSNHRVAKANDTYYLLKKTSVPIVIVECGFMSNHQEEKLLSTTQYQEKLADHISEAVIGYLKNY